MSPIWSGSATLTSGDVVLRQLTLLLDPQPTRSPAATALSPALAWRFEFVRKWVGQPVIVGPKWLRKK